MMYFAFLTDRVVKALQTEKVRYDVINAVTTGKLTDTTQMFTSANALLAHSEDQMFREVESLTRVMRLTSKTQRMQLLIWLCLKMRPKSNFMM